MFWMSARTISARWGLRTSDSVGVGPDSKFRDMAAAFLERLIVYFGGVIWILRMYILFGFGVTM